MSKKKSIIAPNRRQFLAGSAAAALGASTLGLPRPGRAQVDRPITVATWGGFFEESMSEFVYPPFTAKTGIEVDSVAKTIGDAWLVQVDQAKRAGEVLVDVSGLIDVPMERGQTNDLWEPLDTAKLPNIGNLSEIGKHYDRNGVLDGVSWGYYYIVLVSNTEAFPEPPDSWEILWDPALRDMIGVMAQPDVGFLIDITAQTWFGGLEILDTDEGILEVLEKIRELKPNIKLWFRDEAQLQQGLESGEIPIGLYYNDVAEYAISTGVPIQKSWTKQGPVRLRVFWAITTGTDANDESHAFLNFTMTPEAQEVIARMVGIAPPIPQSTTDLTDDEWAVVTTDGPAILPNFDMYVNKGDWISDRWTEMITD